MFRFLLITACLAVPVLSYSAGAPPQVCTNNLTPEHGLDGQTSPIPYSLDGANKVQAGQKLALTLGGGDFLGFAIQAHNDKNEPIGTFHTVDSGRSQTLDCKASKNTLTHKKLAGPIKTLKFEWEAPKNYRGKVRFYATVAKNGATYWIRKELKTVQVE